MAATSSRIALQHVRNIGFIAHIDAGKTTVTERALFFSGRTHRVGSVDQGTAVMDWMAQERERGITITSAATTTHWGDHRINVIDTPGHVDFTAEVERSLRVLDGGVVILDGVAGVQPQSETVWRQADRYRVPRLCFINKMDRVGSDFQRAISSMRRRLGANPVPLQMPLGREGEFRGVADLVHGTACTYEGNRQGVPARGAIPGEWREEFDRFRETMLEKVVEHDDELMARYLEGGEIAPRELQRVIRKATVEHRIVPVLCGSALRGMGIHPLLDAIVAYLPSPAEVPPVEGINPASGERETRAADDEAPLAALVFKVVTDPYVGRLVYFRVYSGTAHASQAVYNVAKRRRERLGRLLRMHANHREEVDVVASGDIAAAVGLKESFTGDTLADSRAPVLLESIRFPEPVLSVAVEPKSRAEQDAVTDALLKLADEDPTFRVRYDGDTGQTLISGMGELHLEVLLDRLRREFRVDTNVGRPRVAYRESIARAARAEGRFVRQTGGRGQYGHVWLEVEPVGRGEGFSFEDRSTGGVVPREFVPAVQSGVRDALENGVLAGYPVVDVRAALVDGSYHPVDSSEMAFKVAGSQAMREAMQRGRPYLLEPIMTLEVITPGEFLGEVLGDLNGRRAHIRQIEGHEGEGATQVVRALVPLAAVAGYTTDLRSLTQGRATTSMEFSHYESVPETVAQEAVKKAG